MKKENIFKEIFMSININSEAACRRAYINYHCYENSMGITEDEMSEIVQTWGNRVNSWQNSVSNDENEYEFDDSDFKAYNRGRQEVEDASGKANKGGQIARGAVDAVAGIGGAAWNVATGGLGALAKEGKALFSKEMLNSNLFNPGSTANVAGEATKGVTKEVTEEVTKEVTEETAENATKEVSKAAEWSTYIQAALAIATALMYRIDKPNKDEVAACDEYQNLLGNAQYALMDAQDIMEDAKDELEKLSDEAYEKNEEGNEQIEENKTEQDFYLMSLNSLKAKAESGTPLTKAEQAFYNNLVKVINSAGTNIQDTSENMTDEVGEIYDEMGGFQEVYDDAASTSVEVLGMTDEAESLDKSTKAMCILQSVSQGMNAASGVMAGAKLMGMGWWNWALGIASIAAGVSSGVAVAEQISMAKNVQDEINVRETTQGMNVQTQEMYEEEIDVYEGLMTGVEDLEIEEPEEFKVPDASGNITNNQPKKPKKEQEKKPETPNA